MSRLGKKGITMPEKTEATFSIGTLSVKGPKGSLNRDFRSDIKIVVDGKQISLSVPKENNQTKALWGTYASHIKNMVKGVNDGFEKKLVLEGVGYKSQVTGTKLILALGFSHQVEVEIPAELKVKAEKNLLTISGIDKELVGSFSAQIRDLKKPEPYKGKGFHYSDEVVRRKQGKKSI
ncbi:MAG: 50S ribosomal protein L6 [Candidatus Zambryskibacteria bacterium RIFCSPHIGHO2_12_FULL_38_34]|uniref:50S ribosomal protein L6 n=1 Tax=Candidatus Zambryskibacteria bacterium RIFCSPLOWO2_12_FULL_39_16 TaxID=1802775 RepID=A0A1G2URS9_9BACT|nr:MAG: 50S ribosomal protein L6 [Candidatus Zambryskibacteria bacterium RIFCSPHIGHO2_02_FULL_38_22]OHA98397.1 MAG: 50S ribosomal protein L6 [Candidatus Zambryskibacteria bacterium RIFCSPHIGHO2_12_FULL_38_34]OHB12078.1 MAG: 50S ribosomal protein L6 [Candidatus Zambryskibacteria bacterium RIFCSPLOWO2_12_FULL_39_16]